METVKTPVVDETKLLADQILDFLISLRLVVELVTAKGSTYSKGVTTSIKNCYEYFRKEKKWKLIPDPETLIKTAMTTDLYNYKSPSDSTIKEKLIGITKIATLVLSEKLNPATVSEWENALDSIGKAKVSPSVVKVKPALSPSREEISFGKSEAESAFTDVVHEMWRELDDVTAIAAYYDEFKYQGFDPKKIISKASDYFSPKGIIQLSLIGALRGSNSEKYKTLRVEMKDTTTSTIDVLIRSGVLKRRRVDMKDTSDLSVLRITAAFPGGAAYMLYVSKAPRRILTSQLPAWLQFPAAAGIKMDNQSVLAMKEFSKEFTKLINRDKNGEPRPDAVPFNEQLFETIVANARSIVDEPYHAELQDKYPHFT